MSTLGSTPSFTVDYFSDSGTSCNAAPNEVETSVYTMPSAGWVTGIVFYAAGDGSTSTLTGQVWDTSGNNLGHGSGVSCPTGSRSPGHQAWHTDSCGFFLPSGKQIHIGWQKGSGATMTWSTNGTSGGIWGYNGTTNGPFSSCGAIGIPGAYITYNAISLPSSTTSAASAVGSTTATLNGTAGDGGQNGSGDPNNSSYLFRWGTDPSLNTYSTTSATSFDGLGQAASANLTGLTVNTTYYFQLVCTNDAGTTLGSILSFSTLGLPNAPTLNSPANNTAVNAQSSSVTFNWTYNTGGAGGGETAYALKLTTGGVDQWWNGTSLVSSETYVTTASTSATVGAGILTADATYLWAVSSQDANGKGPYASQLTLISEGPPAAPTLLLPLSGTYMDMAGSITPTFSWTYNPTNGVGGQTNFAIRRKISGGSSYSYYNVGTSSWQGTIVWNAQTTQSFTFPSGKWSDGNIYNWSVATQDAGGQGPFAGDFTLTAQAVPVVTVTAPSGSISASKPVVTWSVVYPSGAGETSYQVRTFSAAQYGAGGFNPATSVATDDSGVVSSGSTVSYQVQTSLPAGSSFRSYVQVIETGAEPSGFLAFGAFTVALDLPPTPTLTAVATTDPVTGCPMIQLTAQSDINILSSDDASFEASIGTYVGSNATLAQSATQALDGSFSLRLTCNGSTPSRAVSGFYAALPSTQYSLGAFFRAGSTGRSVLVALNWYDSTHTLISSSSGSTVSDVTTGWTQATVTATSPSNAAFVTVRVEVDSAANTEIHYVDEVGLFFGASTAWSAGGFLASAGIVILRSDGVYVRNASTANPAPVLNTQAAVVVNDYEVTPLTAYTYQALVQATGAQGLVQSAYSAQAGASVSTTAWWELDPTVPSTAIDAQPIQFNPSITEQSAAHQVLGQQTMNIIASAVMGTDMTATMEVFDAPTFNALMALATSQKTIFFSDPYGHSYYFRIAPGPGGMSSGMGNKVHDSQLLPSTAAAPHRTVSLTGVAQPRPQV